MARILSTDTDKLVDLKSDLIISLELQRGEGCDLAGVRATAERLADAVRPLLDEAEGDSMRETFDAVFPAVESAYEDWKAIDAVFAETTRLAYDGAIPRVNLLLDQIHADLRERVGYRLAERYTALRSHWRTHVDANPWDTYMHRAPAHIDGERLEASLGALVRGDELDVEDAMSDLTGDLRWAFVDFIESHPDDVSELEIGIWKRPEILVAGDFWTSGRRRPLIDVLAQHGTQRFNDALLRLRGLFDTSTGGAARVVSELDDVPAIYRERFNRCLMLHPDYEVRRYAAGNSDINSIWKVISPDSVPCATILSLLEHLVGSTSYTTAQRKVFFDAVHHRLTSLSSRSDVLYARGIARILTRLDFFMEDDYFNRLILLLEYLAAREKAHNIEDDLMNTYTDRLKREKDRVGSRETHEPSFDGVPLVILRKLARDGHFWFLLSMHPIVKIARETIPFINSTDRALQVAANHRVNPEVLRVTGRRRNLFPRLSARLALLSNPKTPPSVSMDYLPDLTRRDIEQLLRRSSIHPELRTVLRNRYNER